MIHTPAFNYKKQYEIVMAKPPKERFMQSQHMTERIHKMAGKRIEREHSEYSQTKQICA
jgi:hypothetical protein